VLTATKHLN